MECPELEVKLLDWILDELAPAEAQELEQHFQHCADCSRSAERLRKVRGALAMNLTDREMPAHLVFIGGKADNQLAGFLNLLWRTAALATVAAAIFLGIVVAGFAHWQHRLAPAASAGQAGLTQADVKALAAQEVVRQMAFERQELAAANAKLAASLRDEQKNNLGRLAHHVDYLQSVQDAVWKETQQQGAMVELIARNSLEPRVTAPGKQ